VSTKSVFPKFEFWGERTPFGCVPELIYLKLAVNLYSPLRNYIRSSSYSTF